MADTLFRSIYHCTRSVERALAFKKSGHGAFLTFAGCLLAVSICGMLIPTMMQDITTREEPQNSSVWVWRGSKDYVLTPVRKVLPLFQNEVLASQFNGNKSYFILGPGEDLSHAVFKLGKPTDKTVKFKEISFFDPLNQMKSLLKTSFAKCEYTKCKIAKKIDAADAVVFEASRLNMTKPPAFKRKPGQIWVFHTTEGPSKYNFFAGFNKTGIRNLFNWTMTFRNKSDIQHNHGYLKMKTEIEPKDYSELYDKKTKTVAWFVSQCATRSHPQMYVGRMKTRVDVDVYGECGTLQCGPPKKAGSAASKDNSTCYTVVAPKYKFFLAFETTLCKEFVTDNFFKLFAATPVDVIPVVRGGANYKKFFPSDMYVDASDFATPEDLADYLVDLGNDKERYIRMLKAKDRWQVVQPFPNWQCSLCEKLHTDKTKKTYKNVAEWFGKDQCFDDFVDSAKF